MELAAEARVKEVLRVDHEPENSTAGTCFDLVYGKERLFDMTISGQDGRSIHLKNRYTFPGKNEGACAHHVRGDGRHHPSFQAGSQDGAADRKVIGRGTGGS